MCCVFGHTVTMLGLVIHGYWFIACTATCTAAHLSVTSCDTANISQSRCNTKRPFIPPHVWSDVILRNYIFSQYQNVRFFNGHCIDSDSIPILSLKRKYRCCLTDNNVAPTTLSRDKYIIVHSQSTCTCLYISNSDTNTSQPLHKPPVLWRCQLLEGDQVQPCITSRYQQRQHRAS